MIEIVTIANFRDAITANLAKQTLEAEGIPALLADEITVNSAWHLTVGLRWIKLQVPEPEAEFSISILVNTGFLDRLVPDCSTDRTPNNTFASEDEEAFPDTQMSAEGDRVVRLSRADRTANRMFQVAVLGLIFFPLQFYVLWLSIRLLVSGRRVSPSQYWKLFISTIVSLATVAFLVILFL